MRSKKINQSIFNKIKKLKFMQFLNKIDKY